jgi:hypothetical protein
LIGMDPPFHFIDLGNHWKNCYWLPNRTTEHNLEICEKRLVIYLTTALLEHSLTEEISAKCNKYQRIQMNPIH